MIPVYSVASFLSLMSPANAIYYTTVRDWCAPGGPDTQRPLCSQPPHPAG